MVHLENKEHNQNLKEIVMQFNLVHLENEEYNQNFKEIAMKFHYQKVSSCQEKNS